MQKLRFFTTGNQKLVNIFFSVDLNVKNVCAQVPKLQMHNFRWYHVLLVLINHT